MTSPPGGALYSPALLALAVELASYPFDPGAPLIGEAHSRSCGSTIQISATQEFEYLGLRVTACAVGQAAAAIFARHVRGRTGADIQTALAEIIDWLAGEGDTPAWPDIEMLDPARAYPGRHGAILLPWRAAFDALSKPSAPR
ncbi:iron-sulfur cluster assembly scaffold protein [Qipengyuania aquimaris]|uniref:iron-sulfur cluster assembly scaffold protein n=1 Tax=Qipengyuania aquimaris TaxID=255984 RepID=UPI001FD56AC0|nr:iron-sulfur cluster assembly scaffold protein [Qipengyuania aquimaris]UOR14870.1 iron-sulfur cluster assembly scaffold protein [Qipengyuania aquimaris]